ncbi:MAG TPA: phospholipase, partial [Micromonosporaceae bacterium]|nr:phospholipase [Micromonosporaceae bacterium]
MSPLNRRQLLGAAAATAAVPALIKELLSVTPAQASTIGDVEHVVIFMQENRSFDHYFGSLRGVRGFGDPTAIT